MFMLELQNVRESVIALALTGEGVSWQRDKVHYILKNTTYEGEFYCFLQVEYACSPRIE